MGGKESKGTGGPMTPLRCMLNNFEQLKEYTAEAGMVPCLEVWMLCLVWVCVWRFGCCIWFVFVLGALFGSLDVVDVYQEKVFPVRVDPQGDLNTANGRNSLRLYQNLNVCALEKGTPRVPNLRKIYQMEQEQNESPVAFLERLREAFEKFSPYDMDDQRDQAAGKIVLKSVFSSQCSPDIRRKLQKDAGLAHLTLERILEIANQVYLSREVVQAKREEAAVSRRAKVIAAVLGHELGKNKCARCHKQRHWAADCKVDLGGGQNRKVQNGSGSWKGRRQNRGAVNQPSRGPVAIGLVDPALDEAWAGFSERR
ncbi:uncharacterized protein LOC134293601 [Anolis carolinensis]|uniref:uncharacterized protein LOC134293601 n=1 Tax=Anolis carolinensis TaxID=28377 RepID=UPI002F2B710F